MLLLWIPLRQRPGLGTLSNVVVVGLVLQRCSSPSTPAHELGRPVAAHADRGVVLNGIATGLYIGARFGPGPRDGLMTGLAAARPLAARGAHGDRAHGAGRPA